MAKFLIIFFAGVVFLSVVKATSIMPINEEIEEESSNQCPANEEYNSCSWGCPRYCLGDDAQQPFQCDPPERCSPGCECKPGYVRNADNVCIPERECPAFQCTNSNQEYSQCGSGCPKTCENTVGGERVFCFGVCVQSCICKEGFVRDSEGNCIDQSECPQVCYSPHKSFNECGTACPKTCENYDLVIGCTKNCVRGCFCEPGYVLFKGDMKCYLPKKCPLPDCGANEVLDKCPRSCPGENSCTKLFFGLKQVCTQDTKKEACKPKCVCEGKYIRDSNGNCVLPKECCSDPNAEVVNCPNPCKGGTCIQPKFSPCKTKCNPKGCQCKKGFVKKSDIDPTCVPLKSCPKKRCYD